MTLEKYISSRLFADSFGITEAISSRKNSTQDGYDWGGVSWTWDIEDFKTILEEAGYKEVEYTGGSISLMFSGNGRHEFAQKGTTGYGKDELLISNGNNKKVYVLGFSPKTGRMVTITEFSNGRFHENMDIPDLRDYLLYG